MWELKLESFKTCINFENEILTFSKSKFVENSTCEKFVSYIRDFFALAADQNRQTNFSHVQKSQIQVETGSKF